MSSIEFLRSTGGASHALSACGCRWCEEKTYTDNISPRGARIFSKHAWQPGDALRLTPLNGYSACGKVV
jgi:hypothetical protein